MLDKLWLAFFWLGIGLALLPFLLTIAAIPVAIYFNHTYPLN